MTTVPSLMLENRVIIPTGRIARLATVHDENWVDGKVVSDPDSVVATLKKERFPADIFTFCQKLPDVTPRYNYRMRWDNVAAVPLKDFREWWEDRLPQESRKNVRRSAKRGVVVRSTSLDEDLVRGIHSIYNEAQVRQGKPFPKFGMSLDAVRHEASQILDRSEFIGAYAGDELIGYIKLIYMGSVAGIIALNSKSAEIDKRPSNALLAKAVEIACGKGMQFITYGRYTYGNKSASPLTEFKRRNGFEKFLLPRYYVPLNFRGRVLLAMRLERNLIDILPGGMVDRLVDLRARIHRTKDSPRPRTEPPKEEAPPRTEGSQT